MTLALAAVGLLLASSLAAAVLSSREPLAFRAGTLGGLAACALGLVGAAASLRTGATRAAFAPWPLPVGELRVGVDPLSSFFLLLVFLVSGLALLHGLGAMPARGARRLPRAAAFLDLTIAAMAVVVLARDGMLFLVGWEAMTIASYFLVAHDDDRAEARRAGMTYLIASHAGAVCLYVLFALLARHAGSFAFDALASAGPIPPALAGVLFGLALAGFGTKAALVPVHVWAPDAYPAAPPHAAAAMSGALSKMGIYGLLRALLLLGAPASWWGTLLVALGAATGLAGALNALAQRDLKRLVAYSSVENLGIIALACGVGLLGRAHGVPAVAFLGFAGALLHALNHGLFKGLLLVLAGDVADATGTRSLDRLGGLARRMPWTALLFLVGAFAASGLPPLNGFASEWLVYAGALRGGAALPPGPAAVAVAAVAALALVGGLAAAAFVKAYGLAFLGNPRSDAVEGARDPRGPARAAAVAGAALCAVLGLVPFAAASLPAEAAAILAGLPAVPATQLGPVRAVAWAGWILLVLVGALALVRLRLLRGREVRRAPVWGCAYAAPTARMQYTAASFPDPALAPFAAVVVPKVEREGPDGYFPSHARYEDRLSDAAGDRLLLPLVRRFVDALGRVRVVQGGRLQLYLLYVLATLIALLVWTLGGTP